jgi:hypothetical protein
VKSFLGAVVGRAAGALVGAVFGLAAAKGAGSISAEAAAEVSNVVANTCMLLGYAIAHRWFDRKKA